MHQVNSKRKNNYKFKSNEGKESLVRKCRACMYYKLRYDCDLSYKSIAARNMNDEAAVRL